MPVKQGIRRAIREERREKTRQLMRDIARWKEEKKAELETAARVEELQKFIEGAQNV